MEKITRKVTATVIHYSEAVLENGMPAFKECPSELVADAVDATQALAYLRKKYGTDRSFLVTGLETSTKKYEMDLALFVKTATPVMEVVIDTKCACWLCYFCSVCVGRGLLFGVDDICRRPAAAVRAHC